MLITNTANFDTIVKKLYNNKEWKELWHFFLNYEYEFGTRVSQTEVRQHVDDIEVSWDVVSDLAKRVKQVALERLRILADIEKWKLAQEL